MLTYTTCRGNTIRLNPHQIVYVVDGAQPWRGWVDVYASSGQKVDTEIRTVDVWCTVRTVDGQDLSIAESGTTVSLAVWKAIL